MVSLGGRARFCGCRIQPRLSAADLGAALRARGIPADALADVEAIVEEAAAEAEAGDVVLVMSNGAFGNIWEKLLEALGGAQS